MRPILTLCLLSLALAAQAQVAKKMHATFDLDEIDSVTIILEGEVSYEKWPGSQLMTETSVQLYNATAAMLRYFVEDAKRYDITAVHADGTHTLHLTSTHQNRKGIKSRDGLICEEVVRIRVFVPESFSLNDSRGLLVRHQASSRE